MTVLKMTQYKWNINSTTLQATDNFKLPKCRAQRQSLLTGLSGMNFYVSYLTLTFDFRVVMFGTVLPKFCFNLVNG